MPGLEPYAYAARAHMHMHVHMHMAAWWLCSPLSLSLPSTSLRSFTSPLFDARRGHHLLTYLLTWAGIARARESGVVPDLTTLEALE